MRAADEFFTARDAQIIAMHAVDRIIDVSREAIAERGRFVLVLTGGSSPVETYKLMAMEPLRSRVAWEHTHVFFGDERAVPPEHAESNYGSAHAALLTYLPLLPRTQLYRMEAEREDLEQAAVDYARKLWSVVESPPVVDLMLLGLGHDGHILSLFPGCPDIERPRGTVVALRDPPMNPRRSRLSMTSMVLSKARNVMVYAYGAAKAEAVRRTFNSPETLETLPARLLDYCEGRVIVLADVASTALLREPEVQISVEAAPSPERAEGPSASSTEAPEDSTVAPRSEPQGEG